MLTATLLTERCQFCVCRAIPRMQLQNTRWYDESPVNGAKNRTSRIPCSDRIWASCGLGYKIGNISFDLAYSYIFVIDSSMDRTEMAPVPTTLRGDYYAHIHVLSAQIGIEF